MPCVSYAARKCHGCVRRSAFPVLLHLPARVRPELLRLRNLSRVSIARTGTQLADTLSRKPRRLHSAWSEADWRYRKPETQGLATGYTFEKSCLPASSAGFEPAHTDVGTHGHARSSRDVWQRPRPGEIGCLPKLIVQPDTPRLRLGRLCAYVTKAQPSSSGSCGRHRGQLARLRCAAWLSGPGRHQRRGNHCR